MWVMPITKKNTEIRSSYVVLRFQRIKCKAPHNNRWSYLSSNMQGHFTLCLHSRVDFGNLPTGHPTCSVLRNCEGSYPKFVSRLAGSWLAWWPPYVTGWSPPEFFFGNACCLPERKDSCLDTLLMLFALEVCLVFTGIDFGLVEPSYVRPCWLFTQDWCSKAFLHCEEYWPWQAISLSYLGKVLESCSYQGATMVYDL